MKLSTILEKPFNGNVEYYSGSNVLPELSKQLVRMMPLKYNDEGEISMSLMLADLRARIAAGKVSWDWMAPVQLHHISNILAMFNHTTRSAITKDFRYCGGVPLLLSFYKEHLGTKYSEWDLTDPKLEVVTDDLSYGIIEYAISDDKMEFSIDELLELKLEALTGTDGRVYPDTGFKCNNVKSTPAFNKIPKLARMSILQLWNFRPEKDHQYLIRNFNDIDAPASYSLSSYSSDLFKPAKELEW